MPKPMTTGVERTSIADMQIGDYIVCKYVATAGAVGTFSEIGTSVATEIPVAGSNVPSGTFYFVKVAKGMIVSDRVVQHTFTWNVMNIGKFIQGKPTTLGITIGDIRSLTGGVAFADTSGNYSTTDLGFGAFPNNNEFGKYILKFDPSLIQAGKTLDDIFHHVAIKTWTQDTPALVIGASTNRVTRGGTGTATFSQIVSTTSNVTIGFRPVFKYIEA